MSTLRYLTVALVAGGTGVLAGILTAPRSGRETRKRIARRYHHESRRLQKGLDRQSRAVREGSRRIVDDLSEQIQDQLAASRKRIAHALPF